MPPRRPAVMAKRPEFAEALAYLRLSAVTRGEGRTVLEWWDAFLSDIPAEVCPAPQNSEATTKRRRKRRRRRRPQSVKSAAPP